MGLPVPHQVVPDQAGVVPRPDALGLEEPLQAPLEARQVVERHALEVVMLEVEIGIEVREVPQRISIDSRAPLAHVGGIDPVVLPEPVDRERDREDQQIGQEVGAGRGAPTPEQNEYRGDEHMPTDGQRPLDRDLLPQGGFVGRGLPLGRREVDREQRRRHVQRLEPARVALRSEMRPLGILDRRCRGSRDGPYATA